ncbi:MAG TPA: WYL domain-containing protein, partial [Clostridia bacterium]|nr:WYL domain-containing protein [Clostridia bacterium]
MKIDRLLGILSVLAACSKTTAPALAERFEVSRKTIQRDINDLCMAGFPVVTEPGRGGGLSLMAGFEWEKTLLSNEEMRLILAGVGALGSVSNLSSLDAKLRPASREACGLDTDISIDLASFYRGSLTDKIARIRNAIAARRKIRFDYYYEKGDCVRTIAPHRLLFRWSAWYVQGVCDERMSFRTFKLNRLWNL